MRGDTPNSRFMFSYVSVEDRIPADHPLRGIKRNADRALASLNPVFARMYSDVGRPSIPPEVLLKAQLLIALYSVRSDRLFCEMLEYNLLFRWFLDMEIDGTSFDASSFSKNRQRLIEHKVAQRFFREVVNVAREAQLLSDEHFSVDGTLIDAWASMKSFQRKGEKSRVVAVDDPGNPTVSFRGEKRSNETHESTTDPDARLARKSPGTGARLAYSGNVLMENRNGLCVDIAIENACGPVERRAALRMIRRYRVRTKRRMKSVGADKGYHGKKFVRAVRRMGVGPHVAEIQGRFTPGLDRRTTRHYAYALSQRIRKRIEETFGWMKGVGGLAKTRFRGLLRVTDHAYLVATAYDLLRIAKLLGQAPTPA